MSTLLYGARVAEKEDTPRGGGKTQSYIDALVALVPGEVLLAHAVVLGFSTRTTPAAKTSEGPERTTVEVTDPTTLRWAFIALALLSVGFWLVARTTVKDKENKAPSLPILLVQCLIPPLAFACWTMLQAVSAFDGLWPELGMGPRQTIGVIGAVGLGLLAGLLGYRLAQKDVKKKGTGDKGEDAVPRG